MKRKRKPYFPNNYEAYAQCPASFFESITYEEFYDWKISEWIIPSSVAAIVRTTDVKTKQVKEFVYKTDHGVEQRIKKLLADRRYEFVVCSAENIHHLSPNQFK